MTANTALAVKVLLPPVVRARGGAVFDPSSDVWSYKDGTQDLRLNFESALPNCSIEFLLGLKMTLVWYAENKSLSYVTNLFMRLAHFLRFTATFQPQPLSRISAQEVINYRATLDASNEWYLRVIGILLSKWHELGYDGVDAHTIKAVRQMRLKSNARGVAVLTMDAQNGPYTDVELESIQAALDRAYASNAVAIEDYLLVYLFILLGARPVQFASLKLGDFRTAHTKDGATEYCLRVPRAKQRHGKPRLEFKERLITRQIGELLKDYADELHRQFTGLLADPTQAPLFPGPRSAKSEAGFEYHCTSAVITRRLEKCLNGLNAYSERTGSPLHITATRFRRTLGTRAAAEGHGELIIAELLDHSDTTNVGVYVAATPAIVERIDRAVALQMAPLAQAFAGVLVRSESDAVRGDDPASRIIDPRIDKSLKPMGNCGKHGFCGQLAPIACYTCTNFQPWLDGPHEAVLNHLIAERERLLTTTDKRIASVNDRTILAVAEVVRRCQEQRGDQVGDGNG